MLKLAWVFPAAAWGLQAFTASDELRKPCVQSRQVGKGNDCTKILEPSLMFIGQPHSGSTSLHGLLELHPEVHGGDMKEHHYFDAQAKKAHKKSANSLSEYKKQFCVPCNATIGIDATMEYIKLGLDKYGGRKAVEKVRSALGGNVKILMMLRDPVDLLFSSQCQGKAHPKRPFHPNEPPNITDSEMSVATPLNTWLEVFPNKKNWLFLSSEEFFANPQKVMNKVFKFLGIKSMDVVKMSKGQKDSSGDHVGNQGRRRCTIHANSNERKAYFSVQDNVNDQKKLEKLTGLKFKWQRA